MAVHARRFVLSLLLLGLALLAPSPAAAQDTAYTTTTTTQTEEEDDNDFPWGLLGLLGLAGLIPRGKKTEVRYEEHVRTAPPRDVPLRDDRPGTPPPPRV